MRTDYENDRQKLSPSVSDEENIAELNSQEASEQTSDQEEELYFWSEPGVCG